MKNKELKFNVTQGLFTAIKNEARKHNMSPAAFIEACVSAYLNQIKNDSTIKNDKVTKRIITHQKCF